MTCTFPLTAAPMYGIGELAATVLLAVELELYEEPVDEAICSSAAAVSVDRMATVAEGITDLVS